MMDRRGTTRARHGFTLLELMLVVTMICILATFSIGQTSRILTSWRVTRAAQAMGEEMQQAFALVGRNRKPVIIKFDTDSMTLFMKGRSGTVYHRRYFGVNSEYNLSASDLYFSTYTLEVYPPGLAADSLSIVISKPGTARRIRMLRGGLVQICPTGAKNRC